MSNKWQNLVVASLVLFMLVALTSVFIFTVTFGGSELEPDIIATYTKNKISWSAPTVDGIAQLNIFGDPAEGEEYPIVHPFSQGTYNFRFMNEEKGRISYSLYFYTENPHDIPLEFTVSGYEPNNAPAAEIPSALKDKQILKRVNGRIGGNTMQNFTIDWFWKTETDEIDTAYGDRAVEEDLLYTFNVYIVVEDNNSYKKGSSTAGGGTTVTYHLHRAYVIGYPEGDFRQNGNMTRAEGATIFARILADYDENNLQSVDNSFSDVPQNLWYSKYISRIEHTNIMSGYPDGSFHPDGSITRAEFAALCVRYTEHATESNLNKADISFSDFSKDHWAYDTIRKAVYEGYIKGYPDGTVRADQYISRAEVVTTVNRLLRRGADVGYVDSNLDKLAYFWDLTDNTYWAYYDIYEAANQHYAVYEDYEAYHKEIHFREKWFD